MNIYVGNLPYKFNDQDLEGLFQQHGAVDRARVITDRETGRSKGFGFVTMPNDDEARNAIEALNGNDDTGRPLRVNEAEDRGRPGGGGGGGRRH